MDHGRGRGVATAHLLSGNPGQAIKAFAQVLALTRGHTDLNFITVNCLGYSALAAADAGDWRRARKWARDARAMSAASGLDDVLQSTAAYTAHAAVLLHDGLLPQAGKALDHVRRLLPMLHALRWFEADISLRCADMSLDLGDTDAGLGLADIARAALDLYPDPGKLRVRLAALDARLSSGGDLELTPSELRLVPFLPSHLSLQEIGDRLFLSRATVKTHTDSIYRKLGVASRSSAVERLEELGLAARAGRLSGRPGAASARRTSGGDCRLVELGRLLAGERRAQKLATGSTRRGHELIECLRLAHEHEHRGVGSEATLELVDHRLEGALGARAERAPRQRSQGAPEEQSERASDESHEDAGEAADGGAGADMTLVDRRVLGLHGIAAVGVVLDDRDLGQPSLGTGGAKVGQLPLGAVSAVIRYCGHLQPASVSRVITSTAKTIATIPNSCDSPNSHPAPGGCRPGIPQRLCSSEDEVDADERRQPVLPQLAISTETPRKSATSPRTERISQLTGAFRFWRPISSHSLQRSRPVTDLNRNG